MTTESEKPFDQTRRCDILKMSVQELSIHNCIIDVEKMGADVRLTDAVMFLQAAKESVADFLDKQPRRARRIVIISEN